MSTEPSHSEESTRTCPDCDGAGWVVVAMAAPLRGRIEDVRVTGAREERCMACLGTGRRTS